MSSLDFANTIAAFVSLSLLAASVYAFRSSPAALVFIAYLTLGGPLKALLYDTGLLRKSLDTYPFSLTSFNSIYALVDVVLVLGFLFIWFQGAPRLVNLELCHRLRVWSVAIFVTFTAAYCGEAIRSWGQTVTREGNLLFYNPGESLLNSASPLEAIAVAVLVVVSGSAWVSGLVLAVFAFTALWSSGFQRGAVVAAMVCIVVLKVERLRPVLVTGLLATALLTASVGAVTRGTESLGGSKVLGQAFGDLQFLDQSISYYEKCSGDLWTPRVPSAFAETFAYGFMPRFIFRDKPALYGNHIPEMVLAPITRANGEQLDRNGKGGGFFPISTWVEMFFDFGLPFGLLGFFLLAVVLRWTLQAARTNVYAWLFTLMNVTVAIGLFRGGSNWLMMNLKATVIFALTYAPVEWLVRTRKAATLRLANPGVTIPDSHLAGRTR
jgi:hypothetical protein